MSEPCRDERVVRLLGGVLLLIGSVQAAAYPIDGYPQTGIRRLEYYRLAAQGEIEGKELYRGALQPLAEVRPRLVGQWMAAWPAPDSAVSARLATLPASEPHNYGIALLDLTDPAQPVYAEHNGGFRDNVGSVGKLMVALSLFQCLADIYPDDIEARRRVLRDTWIVADDYIERDHHPVPFFNRESRLWKKRALRLGDGASLYEYLDWMLSASSNAAAAMVQKQVLLLAHFGRDYPVSAARAAAWLSVTPKKELGERFQHLMTAPLVAHGFDTQQLRQGSFFTRRGQQRVPGTTSYGTPRQLIRYLYLLETGRLVDDFSSTEIKRMLYMTERRIRYASHPALYPDAVYFKSGSLYACVPEEGLRCGKYMGNKRNLLASVAMIEAPAGERRFHYLVVVQSNVLRVNSAVAHQTLGLRVQRLVEALHPELATAIPPNATWEAPVE